MIRRLPIIPTLVVVLAVAVMIRLGLWQIDRAHEHEAVLAQYKAASKLPPIAFPTAPTKTSLPLFRWATGFCQRVIGVRTTGGHNRAGDSGWIHIVDCATGAEGPGMAVEVGWSSNPNTRVTWAGGPVTGMIVRDKIHRIRLIAASAPSGLEPSAIPSPEDAVNVPPIQNWVYVFIWFSFALIAPIIYVLALRKRLREEQPKP